MKKIIIYTITLSLIALAVVFTLTNTYSAEDKMLRKNVAALAQNLPIQDEEDVSIEDPAGGGGGWCYKNSRSSIGSSVAVCARNCVVTDNNAAPIKDPQYCR